MTVFLFTVSEHALSSQRAFHQSHSAFTSVQRAVMSSHPPRNRG